MFTTADEAAGRTGRIWTADSARAPTAPLRSGPPAGRDGVSVVFNRYADLLFELISRRHETKKR
jgi:hypothetical protein